jgi:hypothetical protein
MDERWFVLPIKGNDQLALSAENAIATRQFPAYSFVIRFIALKSQIVISGMSI